MNNNNNINRESSYEPEVIKKETKHLRQVYLTQ